MSSIDKTFNDALAALQERRWMDAERLFKRCIKNQPGHVAALNLLTVALMSMERFAEAEAYIARAVAINRNSDVSFYNYGIILKRLNKPDDALKQFTNAIDLNAKVAETWNNRGTIFNELQQFERALSDFRQALLLNANYADALCNSGKSLNGLRRFDEALEAFKKTIAVKPDSFEALLGIGVVLTELGRFDDAFAAYGKASQLRPGSSQVLLAQGSTMARLKRFDDALAAYDDALALKSDLAEAHLGRGDVFSELKHHDQAFSAYDKALALKPDLPNAWLGRGNLFFDLKRLDEALEAYQGALLLRPVLAEAWLGRGNVFFELRHLDNALEAYNKALLHRPDLAEAWLGLGNLLLELRRVDESIAAYSKSLALKSDLAAAWLGRGNALAQIRKFAEAFAAFDQALKLDSSLSYAEGLRLYCKLHICDWSDFEVEREHLIASIENGALAVSPFPLLGISRAPEEQLLCARLFNKNTFPASGNPAWKGQRYDHDRIRVAYLSADFCDHPTSYLLAGVIEHHDRERFETIAISFGPNAPSQMLDRLKDSFSRFIDVSSSSDREIAALLLELEVDIAVDLMGYTANSRTGILAHRPSPIQVNYLGYPGTMGADYIDYLIADRTLIPTASQPQYAERIVYLPNSYQANDSKRTIGKQTFAREDMGLPGHAFVFCCFNDSYKITPEVFGNWMSILREVEGSVLWLLQSSATSVQNLKEQAGAAGVDPERIVFAERLPLSEHLARHAFADLFLDTLPYNAHTTASDALWTALPILTQIGDSFAGRVAASLLTAIGLPELITYTADAYRDLAIQFAKSPGELAAIKRKLAKNCRGMPLFDTPLYTLHLEAAYDAMYRRHQDGLPLDHICVPS